MHRRIGIVDTRLRLAHRKRPEDNPRSNRPERRTALVVRDLARYKVDIAALSEIPFSEQGQLEEVFVDYTFVWSGRPRAERRDVGVTFAIRNDTVGRLPRLPQGIKDHLMSLRLHLRDGKFATIVSAYAPPMTSPNEARNKFCEDMHTLLASALKTEKRRPCWLEWALATRGLNGFKDNGLLLLHNCTEHSLVLTNTLFCLPEREKATWINHRSRQWHLPDCVLVWRRDQRDELGTNAILGAAGWTDHRLVISEMQTDLQPHSNEQAQPLANLAVVVVVAAAAATDATASIGNRWCQMQDTV
nr:unnamed protein product [Spirometra erinaceieuropaei]